MEGPASTLRLCRKTFISTHLLEVINDGPFVLIVSGVPPEKPNFVLDGLQPKVALFRQASQTQVASLTVVPGQRVSFTSDSAVPDLVLDYRLQAEWEMLSYTVDLVEERGELFIDRTGPTGRAVIECSQAAYRAVSALYSDPAGASNVSLEEIIETAGEAKECKSAIDAAKKEAANQKRRPPIENEDFRKTSLENNSFQRAANNFMDALRRFGKIAKLR